MVEITAEALKILREYLDKSPGKVLCIGYLGLGCNGPNLNLALEDPPEGADLADVQGVKVFVHEDVHIFSEDQLIDYIKDGDTEGFSVVSTKGLSCSGDCGSCGQAES